MNVRHKLNRVLLTLPIVTLSCANVFAGILSVNEGSALSGNLFCYREIDGDKNIIVVVNLEHKKMDRIYTKDVPSGCQDPICLKDGIVIVEVDGRIVKYNLHGKLVFSRKIENFLGASKFSSRVSNSMIIVEQTWSVAGSNNLLHELIFVDVGATSPLVKARIRTSQVFKVVRCGGEFFACGVDQAQKIAIP